MALPVNQAKFLIFGCQGLVGRLHAHGVISPGCRKKLDEILSLALSDYIRQRELESRVKSSGVTKE